MEIEKDRCLWIELWIGELWIDFDFDFDLLSEHPVGTQGHKNTKKETKGRKVFENKTRN